MTRVLIVGCQSVAARILIAAWPATDELYGFDALPAKDFQHRVAHLWGDAEKTTDVVMAFERARPDRVVCVVATGGNETDIYGTIRETAMTYGAAIEIVGSADDLSDAGSHGPVEPIATGLWRRAVPGGWLYQTDTKPGTPTTYVPAGSGHA